MQVWLTIFILVALVGCTAAQSKLSNKPQKRSAAMVVAQVITEQDRSAAEIQTEFTNKIVFEDSYWRQELAKVLDAEQLPIALAELELYIRNLQLKGDDLISREALSIRFSELLAAQFSVSELHSLAQFLRSDEWQKYQVFMAQLSRYTDALHVHSDFQGYMESERELFAKRVFGGSTVDQAASVDTVHH